MASISSEPYQSLFFTSKGNYQSTPPASEDAPSSLADDDDVTLESLTHGDESMIVTSEETGEGGYDESCSLVGDEGTPVENKAVPSSVTTKLEEMNVMNGSSPCSSHESQSNSLVLSQLEDCKQNNPVSALSHYYQTKGLTDLKACFQESECHVGKNSSYWWYNFACPISGKVFQSSLPTPLLDNDPDEAMIHAVKEAFGEFEVMDNGQVAFSSKKGAKRSVAFAAWHSLRDSFESLPPLQSQGIVEQDEDTFQTG